MSTPIEIAGPVRERSIFEGDAQRSRFERLADLDPDLFAPDGADTTARTPELPRARVVELCTGRWDPRPGVIGDAAIGLLVVEGLVTRSFSLGAEVTTELLGTGDLIRPWEAGPPDATVLESQQGWQVLEPARVAVLGRSIAAALTAHPDLLPALFSRLADRSRSQGIFVAIAHTKRIDRRLLMLLWHLAERWGRVTTDGVLVPVNLTHRRLASLVGAQRPSVTAALTVLTARGLVLRTPGRGFLLTDAARDEVDLMALSGDAVGRAVAV